MTNKKKHKDYLSNKEMFAEIIKCQGEGIISDKLGKMFVLLCKHYATKPNFSGYTYVDEMVASGITSCCVAFNKFDGEKSKNPFAYFTMVVHHSFLQILNKEKNHQNIRDSLLLEAELNPSQGYIDRENNKKYDEEIPLIDESKKLK